VTPELTRVITLARRRGACVRVVNQEAWDSASMHSAWHDAPFSHWSLAINEQERAVYVLATDALHTEVAGSIIHELGHLHASPRRESVSYADEYGWMAWEIAVAREARVRGVWDLAMKDYGLGSTPAGLAHLDGMEWGEITRGEQRAIIADRMKVARRRGIVDPRGRAVWRRLPTIRDNPERARA
jgi:hypothetical protein